MEDAEPHAHYSRGEERDRLSAGRGQLEFTRTTEIILRSLPAAPALVADIGDGPGRPRARPGAARRRPAPARYRPPTAAWLHRVTSEGVADRGGPRIRGERNGRGRRAASGSVANGMAADGGLQADRWLTEWRRTE